jgi:hypothetical protein
VPPGRVIDPARISGRARKPDSVSLAVRASSKAIADALLAARISAMPVNLASSDSRLLLISEAANSSVLIARPAPTVTPMISISLAFNGRSAKRISVFSLQGRPDCAPV